MVEISSVCLGPLLVPGIFVVLAIAVMSIKIVYEYQRGILFTLGRFSGIVTPGLNFIIPLIQDLRSVDVRITTVDIPKQEVMTKDNVPVSVNAVVYCRVLDPKKAILSIQNYIYAVSQYGQTALRDVIGNKDLDYLLTEREQIANQIKEIVDKETDEWGVDITSIKIQDIELPKDMKRAMARQAEAEREKRATIIKSGGEVIAAENLKKAANTLSQGAGALHLRTLQTISDISSDPSNKIILAVPMEILRAFESIAGKNNKKK